MWIGRQETVAQRAHSKRSHQLATLVSDWKAADHIDITESTFPLSFDINGTSVVDLEHFTRSMWRPNGDYIVSARHMDAVFRVDHVTGNIIWKLGGTAAKTRISRRTCQVLNDPLGGPSAPTIAAPPCRRSISLFDNHFDGHGATRAPVYAVDTVAPPPLSRAAMPVPTAARWGRWAAPGQCGRTPGDRLGLSRHS